MFENRASAGRRLAERLLRLRNQSPVVLALPRGGVPVAAEIARALHAPLDLVLVRKIGAPMQPELAVGAIIDADRTEMVLNHEIADALGVSDAYISAQSDQGLAELKRRRDLYLSDRPRVDLGERVVVLVDDGIATGATVRAALRAIRRASPARLILAVPVAASSTLDSLESEVDEIVCLLTPEPLVAIGRFYRDFHQLTDGEVRDILAKSPSRLADPGIANSTRSGGPGRDTPG